MRGDPQFATIIQQVRRAALLLHTHCPAQKAARRACPQCQHETRAHKRALAINPPATYVDFLCCRVLVQPKLTTRGKLEVLHRIGDVRLLNRNPGIFKMRAQQLADARAQTPGASPASPPPGNRGTDPGLLAQYTAALQQAIVRQWTRPESVQLGQRCRISIRQLPGGEVVDVTIAPSCPFDALGRQSVERAVLKASPLPYAGFESVFDRNLTLNFVAEER